MFEPGTIIMVPYPFTDQSQSKRRPVLALTRTDPHGDFVACPVTFRGGWVRSRQATAEDLANGVLPLTSWVQTDRVVSLNEVLALHQLGRVTEAFRMAVASDVCRFISNL